MSNPLTKNYNFDKTRLALAEAEKQILCWVCGKIPVNPYSYVCGHFFCHTCFNQVSNECPKCSMPSDNKDMVHDTFIEKLIEGWKAIAMQLEYKSEAFGNFDELVHPAVGKSNEVTGNRKRPKRSSKSITKEEDCDHGSNACNTRTSILDQHGNTSISVGTNATLLKGNKSKKLVDNTTTPTRKTPCVLESDIIKVDENIDNSLQKQNTKLSVDQTFKSPKRLLKSKKEISSFNPEFPNSNSPSVKDKEAAQISTPETSPTKSVKSNDDDDAVSTPRSTRRNKSMLSKKSNAAASNSESLPHVSSTADVTPGNEDLPETSRSLRKSARHTSQEGSDPSSSNTVLEKTSAGSVKKTTTECNNVLREPVSSTTPSGKRSIGYSSTPDRKTLNQLRELNKCNAKGESQLHLACIKNNEEGVKKLLEMGANPNVKDNAGWTPLHEAANRGNTVIVGMLLKAGVMVNVPGGDYNITPLHDAVMNYRLDTAHLLLMHGADINARDAHGKTPRDYAENDVMLGALSETKTIKTVVSVAPSTLSSDIVLFGQNLDKKQVSLLQSLASKHDLKINNSLSASVTHVIMPVTESKVCSFSLVFLQAILQGKWIVSYDWISQSNKENKLLDPELFEVLGTERFPDSNAPRKARLNAQNLLPKLLNGFHVYLHSGNWNYIHNDAKVSKSQLAAVIKSGGGVVLSREPDPEAIPSSERVVPYHASIDGPLASCAHYIIYHPGKGEPLIKYNMKHVKTLPDDWLVSCVETFTLREPA